PEMLAGFGCGKTDLSVQEVRRANRHHVHLGIREHLTVVGGPTAVAERLACELHPVRGGIRGDHEFWLDAELGVDDRHVAIRPGMQLTHPADTDQPGPNTTVRCAHLITASLVFRCMCCGPLRPGNRAGYVCRIGPAAPRRPTGW